MPIFFSIILLASIKFMLFGTRTMIKALVLKTTSDEKSEKVDAYITILLFILCGPILFSIFPILIFQGDFFFLGFFNENIRNFHLNFHGIFKSQFFTLYLLMLPIFIYQPLKYLWIIKYFGYKSLIEKINRIEDLTLAEKTKIIDLLQFDHSLKIK